MTCLCPRSPNPLASISICRWPDGHHEVAVRRGGAVAARVVASFLGGQDEVFGDGGGNSLLLEEPAQFAAQVAQGLYAVTPPERSFA